MKGLVIAFIVCCAGAAALIDSVSRSLSPPVAEIDAADAIWTTPTNGEADTASLPY